MGKASKKKKKKKVRKKARWRFVLMCFLLLLVALVATPYILARKPSPVPGTHVRLTGDADAPADIEFLVDSTAYDPSSGKRVIEQEIFDEVLSLIDGAEDFVYVDFFLWNDWQGLVEERHRSLADQLSNALMAKKASDPDVSILVMVDPINRCYGLDWPERFTKMSEAGIAVVFTDLKRLPDSNSIYSPPARLVGRMFGNAGWFKRILDKQTIKNPLKRLAGNMTRRQFAQLMFFKANHRKIAIADMPGGEWKMIVSSMNPSDNSSAHINCGLAVRGDIARRALGRELQCARWSAENVVNCYPGREEQVSRVLDLFDMAAGDDNVGEAVDGECRVEFLTEGAIRTRVLSMLNNAVKGDQIRIAMFYLSDFDVVRAIADAAYGGADVRIILDANKDAFGHTKPGIPNRCVAGSLVGSDGETDRPLVRWADTRGEQFHAKAMSISNSESGKYELICGSANWTRRNIQDLNMEANLYVSMHRDVVERFSEWFDMIWSNADGLCHTLPYEQYALDGWAMAWRRPVYWIQEKFGAGTF